MPLKLDRHYNYLWNRVPRSNDERTAMLFGKASPTSPELYITDFPSGASTGPVRSPHEVTKVSLGFKTCIYRTVDVSPLSPASGDGLPEPIHCVRWTSTHVLNNPLHQFDSPDAIDPFCLVPNSKP